MATKTDFLQLTLPLNNEYQNTWDQPMNDNLQKVDDFAKAMNEEIISARHGKTDLAAFLDVAHNSDGSLKPTDEVVAARNSFAYGDEDALGDFDLGRRLDRGDTEVFDAREGAPLLLVSIQHDSFRLQRRQRVSYLDG
jgi:hypothetical protein